MSGAPKSLFACKSCWWHHFQLGTCKQVFLFLTAFRTVEINNTDAEGRLVVGDGVCRLCALLEGPSLLYIYLPVSYSNPYAWWIKQGLSTMACFCCQYWIQSSSINSTLTVLLKLNKMQKKKNKENAKTHRQFISQQLSNTLPNQMPAHFLCFQWRKLM